MEELVRQQQAAAPRGIVVDERVLRDTIVRALVMLDAERTEVVAEGQQPVELAIVADTAEDSPFLEDDLLVDVDARLRELQCPFAVGDDIDDVLARRDPAGHSVMLRKCSPSNTGWSFSISSDAGA